MSTPSSTIDSLRRKIKRLCTAEREHAWIGAQDPQDRGTIEKELRLANAAVEQALIELERLLANRPVEANRLADANTLGYYGPLVRRVKVPPHTLECQAKFGNEWRTFWSTNEMSNDYAYTDTAAKCASMALTHKETDV